MRETGTSKTSRTCGIRASAMIAAIACFTLAAVAGSGADRTAERMERIVIPKLDFNNADIEEVVAFFQKVAHELAGGEAEQAITFRLAPGYFGGMPGEAPAPDAVADKPKITLKATNISLHDALCSILPHFRMTHVIADGVVLIVPRNAPDAPLVVRSYSVLPNVGERIECLSREVGGLARPEEGPLSGAGFGLRTMVRGDWKDFFAKMGMPWPAGSGIYYVPSIGRIVVTNTEKNLEIFEKILATLNVVPNQVEIEAQFVAFKKEDIENLARKGKIAVESLMQLRAEGKSELLAAPKVLTQAGQEVTTKGVTEYIYPTEFTVGDAVTNASCAAGMMGAVVEPGGFETREVGAILTVTPEVDAGGGMINLTLSPEMVFEPLWRDYGQEWSNPAGKPQKARMEQPFFHTHAVFTSVLMENGGTVLIGGGNLTREHDKMIYIFLSARLVGVDGKPLAPKAESVSVPANPAP